MGSGPILSPLATTVAPLVARTLTTVEPPRKTPSAHEGSQRNGFASLQTTITNGNLVLLLVERLEKKDEGNTHYLLCVGYQVLFKNRSRRGRNSYRLLVKDPMDGDEVLAAALWEDQDAELRTKQTGGGGTGSLQDPRGDPSVRHEREDPQETTRIALTVFINEIPKRRCT